MWEMALAAEPSARGASVAQCGSATLHLAPSLPLASTPAFRAYIAIIAERTFAARAPRKCRNLSCLEPEKICL